MFTKFCSELHFKFVFNIIPIMSVKCTTSNVYVTQKYNL